MGIPRRQNTVDETEGGQDKESYNVGTLPIWLTATPGRVSVLRCRTRMGCHGEGGNPGLW